MNLKKNPPQYYRSNSYSCHILKVYIGQESVRGIYVNHWQSSYNWPGSNYNYTIDYYFSGNKILW